jgi:tRNA pseudouridine55 synthase
MSSFCGLLNLDKPAGMSSRTAVDVVARLVRPTKVGHAGTLDPIATGVLVACLGPATRLISFVQDSRKTYRATFRFGVTSVTDDIEGVVVELPDAPRLQRDDIEAVVPEFLGVIEQIPPMFSAVHVQGQRAYELARRGQHVSLAPRSVEVYRYDIAEFDEESQVLVAEIECGSGTYIRSLGRDLAKRLGTSAVMTALRRTGIGSFAVNDALSVNDLSLETIGQHLLPASSAVADLPKLALDDAQIEDIRHGRFLTKPAAMSLADDASVALLTPDGQLAAVASVHADGTKLRPKIVLPAE